MDPLKQLHPLCSRRDILKSSALALVHLQFLLRFPHFLINNSQ
jgi:hypothetical protein